MSTYKAPKRKNRRQELREDKVVTFYTQFLDFFEENRGVVFGALGAVVLLIIMGFGYGIFKDHKEENRTMSRSARPNTTSHVWPSAAPL